MTDTTTSPADGGVDRPMPEAPPSGPTFVKRGGGAIPPPGPRGLPDGDAAKPPRAYGLATLALAVLAGLFLAEQRAGLGLALLGIGLIAAAWTLTGRDDRNAFSTATLAAAGVLAAVPVVRDSAWVVTLSLLGSVTLTSIAVARARTWRELGVGVVSWPMQLIPAPIVFGGQAIRRASSRRWTLAGPVARGGTLAVALILLFGALFSAADARFADLARDLVDIDLDVESIVVRTLVFGVVIAIAGALWLTSATRRDRPAADPAARLGRTEWVIALSALLVVFATFVVLQLPVLFGGDELVQRTDGLTYAGNARTGFVQLTAVAILTLALVAAAAHRGPRGDLIVRLLSGILCGLTIVVLASALHRLGLYIDAYGQTRTRFSLTSLMVWLGAVLVLVIVLGGARRTLWLPRAVVAASALFAIGTVALNPDGRVAERNVQRYADTGRIDTIYLGTLSADAMPSLQALPGTVRDCVIRVVAYRRFDQRWSAGLRSDGDALVAQNVSRARARRVAEALPTSTPADIRHDACNPVYR